MYVRIMSVPQDTPCHCSHLPPTQPAHLLPGSLPNCFADSLRGMCPQSKLHQEALTHSWKQSKSCPQRCTELQGQRCDKPPRTNCIPMPSQPSGQVSHLASLEVSSRFHAIARITLLYTPLITSCFSHFELYPSLPYWGNETQGLIHYVPRHYH